MVVILKSLLLFCNFDIVSTIISHIYITYIITWHFSYMVYMVTNLYILVQRRSVSVDQTECRQKHGDRTQSRHRVKVSVSSRPPGALLMKGVIPLPPLF